jgi:5'-nucleotidase
MKILVSNDDGYLATGINALIDALEPMADVTVVAPDRNRSAASNSLTLSRPLRVAEYAQNRYKVDGTPSDCVHLAVTGLLDDEPDLVVSGINHGANLGDDTIYSGTVAAAMEGRFLGLPTIAVSLVGKTLVGARLMYFETAARVAVELVQKIERAGLPPDTVLNVNVPDVPYRDLQGIRATRLAGGGADTGEGTDFHAISEGAASVTPLKVDLTRYEAVEGIAAWLSQ